MTSILGISAFYHDSAAALVIDGNIVAAAQEERFTRKKHDEAFPTHAIEYCLNQAGLKASDLDFVAFYDKPLLKFERLLETYVACAPAGIRSFAKAMPVWVGEKLWMNSVMRKGLGGKYKRRFVYCEHHESHAASAFFPSPFDEAAILTIDGVGEWATTTLGVGRGNRIELSRQISFPHSLGLLYSAFTYFCGFRVNSGEYKLMGLAPYGEPRFRDLILEKLIDLRPDGSFRLNMDYFGFTHGLTMTNARFAHLFGGPPRRPESELTQREMDLAASIQAVTEEAMMRLARSVRASTGMRHLCLAGGVALNCVANGKILSEGIFDDVWIQPAAGDAGGALGVALLLWHQLLGHQRTANPGDAQAGSFLGPDITDADVEALMARDGARATRLDDAELTRRLADLLEQEKVIGLCRGRMEFGPRALGHRSIIGDARSTAMQEVMNLKIKFRESFRPFAPIVLHERAHQWFDMRPGQHSPYMLLVADILTDKRLAGDHDSDATPASDQARGLARLKKRRSVIPAVTHVDYSARVQTVDSTRHPFLHGLLTEFDRRTGVPVLVNTSFNVRGEPVVCTAADAYRCFMATNMDALVLGNHLLLKDEQPNARLIPIDEHLAKFALD